MGWERVGKGWEGGKGWEEEEASGGRVLGRVGCKGAWGVGVGWAVGVGSFIHYVLSSFHNIWVWV